MKTKKFTFLLEPPSINAGETEERRKEMKRLIVMLILLIFSLSVGFLGIGVNFLSSSNEGKGYEWFKILNYKYGGLYPADMLLEPDRIVLPIKGSLLYPITGARILTLDYNGEVIDYIWFDYPDKETLVPQFKYIFKEDDGYFVIGYLHLQSKGWPSLEKLFFMYLETDLKTIRWVKAYNLSAKWILSAVKFKESFYITLDDLGDDFGKNNPEGEDGVLLKVDKNGNILVSKRLYGCNFRSYFVSAESKLFLFANLEVLQPYHQGTLISEVDPDTLEFKWKKSFDNKVLTTLAKYQEKTKELLIIGYDPYFRITIFDLNGNLLKEFKDENLKFITEILRVSNNNYYFFGKFGYWHTVLKLNESFEPVFFKTLGPSYTSWPFGFIEGASQDKFNKWIITYGWGSMRSEIVIMRLNENCQIPNVNDPVFFGFPLVFNLTLPKIEEIKPNESDLKWTSIAEERIKLTNISVSAYSLKKITPKQAPEIKDLELRINFVAKYKIETFVSPFEAGRIEPSDLLLEAGKTQEFKIFSNEGYEIEDVVINGISLGKKENFSITPTEDTKIEVKFKRKIFTIIVEYEPKESGISRRLEIPYGSSVDVYINPYSAYKVIDILVDGISVGSSLNYYNFSNIKENHTIEIICQKKKFIISTKTNEGGQIEPQGEINVEYGESQTFKVLPDKGYKIKEVLVDGKSIGAVSSYTFENITENHTISVIFERITYTITASASLGGMITPSGKITVNYGESKRFDIIPDKGYKIKEVLVDGKSIGAVSSYTFENITENHTISVIFEKEIIKIVFKIGSKIIYVNDSPSEIDVAPIIIEGRTLLPIRWIAEPLGASVSWDGGEKKVTVSFNSNLIELWIGKNIAKVNGINTLIDPNNPKVVPMIISGRTMLPLRFIAENLGCKVDWDGLTKTITITYPKD